MISVEHLTKYYGNFLAVDDISFHIKEGHVYGFLGPNGAGKSTTMNIMTGCLSATSGHVRIDGHDIFEEPGEAKGLRGEELDRQVGEVIRKTGIAGVRNRRISNLSKGYRQRVGIAQALLGNPKVIILDEPTVGLDPLQIIEIRDLIKELGRSHTVIFSSHILSEVQAICDQILIISKGKLVAYDTAANLEKQLLAPSEIRLTTDADPDELRHILTKVPAISRLRLEKGSGKWTVARISTDRSDIYELSGAIYKAFTTSDKMILEMALKKGTLEDVFIELTESSTNETTRKRKEA